MDCARRPRRSAAVNRPMLDPLTNALLCHEFFGHSDKVGLAVATGGMGSLANDFHGDAIGLRLEGLVMKVPQVKSLQPSPKAVSIASAGAQ